MNTETPICGSSLIFDNQYIPFIMEPKV